MTPAEKRRGTKQRRKARALAILAALREVAKCDVVCANCHRRRTAARLVEGYQ